MTSADQSEQQPVDAANPHPESPVAANPSMQTRMWWAVRFVAQPLLFFVAGAALLGLLGIAQKAGWISAGGTGSGGGSATATAGVDYICPMMCTPQQQEPGRCPVCAMELVPASTNGGGDERSIVVDPASRRVANIQTVSVRSIPLTRTIKAVGELQYDEATLRTISAYTDGRFDQLYVDFTGAVVKKGDRLASFYSPGLYSAQVEYLQAGKTVHGQSANSLASVANANRHLLSNSRQRLAELGMSEAQIAGLDKTSEANSRMDIVAPMSGTVIEKLAVQGEYVKAGQPVFRLADLSTVWLMLKLFPEDVSSLCYAQAIVATMKSLPGRTFTGRVAFIDPDVDPNSRTVNVRVVIDNDDGLLRVGDYAKARITVPIGGANGQRPLVYDPELANKWVSPRHPHVVSSEPGICHLSGLNLVSTGSLGFTDQPDSAGKATVIPRNAVLMAAGESVVYVETEPGRFEIRRVVTGAASGEDVVVLKGLSAGETVAARGNFLIDSQMQLAGNPSLIDPTRATPPTDIVPGFDAEMLAALHQLPAEDQPTAIEQVICPVTDFKLGSMGVPPKVMVHGQPVFLCCEGCRESLLKDPEAHLRKLRNYRENGDANHPAGDVEAHLPPIGEIHTDFTDDSFPAIGEIKSLAPAMPDLDAVPAQSVSRDAETGRTQR